MKIVEPRVLEPHAEWHAADVADPESWTLRLDDNDHSELDAALAWAKQTSANPLEIRRQDFPLEGLSEKFESGLDMLVNGRGFTRISALDAGRYSDEDLTLLFWGIGLYFGEPRVQNKYGHLLGDVTDHGKSPDDPTMRGYELGAVGLDHHSDGSDVVGLLCLRAAHRGGRSCVANAVAIHNHLVRERPDLAAALYQRLPVDARGEEAEGSDPFYSIPCFIPRGGRLFVRFNPVYIEGSQRHPDAPRLSDTTREAMAAVSELANDPDFNVYMDLAPGEIQFINNYHVLHGREAYEDDPATGHRRHFKRLWLYVHAMSNRPVYFGEMCQPRHWESEQSMSSLPAAAHV